MIYELWELAAGNRIGEYETETEALDEVRGTIELYGAGRVETLLLDGVDDDGRTHLIAEGAALATLACGARQSQNGADPQPSPSRNKLAGKARVKTKPPVP